MSREDFTVDRLDRIAGWLDLTLAEIFQLAENDRPKSVSFSLEQEKFLCENPRTFLYYHALFSRLQPADIQSQFSFSEAEVNRILFSLDRVNLIQLWPQQKTKIIHRGPIRLISGGPIEKKYSSKIAKIIFDHHSQGEKSETVFRAWEMTLRPQMFRRFSEEVLKIIENYREEAVKDLRLGHRRTMKHYTGIIAAGELYPWPEILLSDLAKKNILPHKTDF